MIENGTENKKGHAALALLALLSPLLIWSIWWDLFDRPALIRQLQSLVPWTLEVNFLLILIAGVLNRRTLSRLLRDIPGAARAPLGAILLLALCLAAFIAPRTHRIYYDEDIHLHIGQNIAELKRAGMCNEGTYAHGDYRCHILEYNKQPYAWPYLLSLLFRTFGTHESPAFWLNHFFFAAAAFAVFLIGLLLFRNHQGALLGALLYTCIPENARWFATASVEPSAALFSTLAVLAALLTLQAPSFKTLLLAAAILPFAAQFRPESVFLYPLLFCAFLLWRPALLKSRESSAAVFLALLFLVPHLLHLYLMRAHPWGSSGSAFSTAYVLANAKNNLHFYVDNLRFPALFTCLFGLGIFQRLPPGTFGAPLRSIREKIFLSAWFLAFFGIFLFFYAGSYDYGVDVRFSLVSYAPLALLAGQGTWGLVCRFDRLLTAPWRILPRTCVVLILLLQWTNFLPFTRTLGQQAWASRADHLYARKMADSLPPDSIVLTHNPNMFFVWGKSAAQVSVAASDPRRIKDYSDRFSGGVFFHYNYWCNVQDPLQQEFCRNILRRYPTTLVESYRERNYVYRLYRMEEPKE